MTEEETKIEARTLIYALRNAAEFLRLEQSPDDPAQEAANDEAARRIERMAARLDRKEAP